eukprot:80670_1
MAAALETECAKAPHPQQPKITINDDGTYSFYHPLRTDEENRNVLELRTTIVVKNNEGVVRVYQMRKRTGALVIMKRGDKPKRVNSRWFHARTEMSINDINKDLKKIYYDFPLQPIGSDEIVETIWIRIGRGDGEETPQRQGTQPMIVQDVASLHECKYFIELDDFADLGKRKSYDVDVGIQIRLHKTGKKSSTYFESLSDDTGTRIKWGKQKRVDATGKVGSDSVLDPEGINSGFGGVYGKNYWTINVNIPDPAGSRAFIKKQVMNFVPKTGATAQSAYYNHLNVDQYVSDDPLHFYPHTMIDNPNYNGDGEYYNGLFIGGIFGGGSVILVLLVFCIGLAFGMMICFGYQKKKELEERKDMDLGQNDNDNV